MRSVNMQQTMRVGIDTLGNDIFVSVTSSQASPTGAVSIRVETGESVASISHMYYFVVDKGEECYICLQSTDTTQKAECGGCFKQAHLACFMKLLKRECPICRLEF